MATAAPVAIRCRREGFCGLHGFAVEIETSDHECAECCKEAVNDGNARFARGAAVGLRRDSRCCRVGTNPGVGLQLRAEVGEAFQVGGADLRGH